MTFKPGKEHAISVLFPETSEEVLQLLHKEWMEGGPAKIGELLVKAVNQDLFSTTEIAKRRGITRRGVSKAAREEATKGALWPRKNEQGDWVAPLIEWERIFKKRKK